VVDGTDKTALHSAAEDVPEDMAKTLIKLEGDTHVVGKGILLDNMQLKQCQRIWRRSYLNSASVNGVGDGQDIVYKCLIQAKMHKTAEALATFNADINVVGKIFTQTLKQTIILPFQESKPKDASEVDKDSTVPPGHWPQRLLHICSMKSLQWQRNN